MQEFSDLIKGIIRYLEERKEQKVDQNYLDRQSHYDELYQFLLNKDFNKILPHLEKGIEKFKNTSFITGSQRYHDKLVELKKHFVFNSEQDKKDRNKKLLNAIKTDDPEQIKIALNQGCYAVVLEQCNIRDLITRRFSETIISNCLALNKPKFSI